MITICHRTAAAAAHVGGTDALAMLLDVPSSAVTSWIRGESRPDLNAARIILELDRISLHRM